MGCQGRGRDEAYNRMCITISFLQPFLCHDLINEWGWVDRMEASDPGIQAERWEHSEPTDARTRQSGRKLLPRVSIVANGPITDVQGHSQMFARRLSDRRG